MHTSYNAKIWQQAKLTAYREIMHYVYTYICHCAVSILVCSQIYKVNAVTQYYVLLS